MSDLPPHHSSNTGAIELHLGNIFESRKPPPKELLDALPIKELVQGAYSYPLDWWNGINLIMGYGGHYGPRAQHKAKIYVRQIQGILNASLQGMPYTAKLVVVVLKYIVFDEMTRCTAVNIALENLKSAQTRNSAKKIAGSSAGRIGGGIFTRYAQQGGRRGAKNLKGNTKVKRGLRLSNTALVALGSLTRLIIKRGNQASAVEMFMAIVFGRTEAVISSYQYSVLYRAVLKCKDLDVPQSEIEAYNNMVREILNEVMKVKMNGHVP